MVLKVWRPTVPVSLSRVPVTTDELERPLMTINCSSHGHGQSLMDLVLSTQWRNNRGDRGDCPLLSGWEPIM